MFGIVDHRGDISYRGAISTRKHKDISSFIDELYEALQQPYSYIDTLLVDILNKRMTNVQPRMVALSVPFPGNLFASFRCGQWLKQHYPDVKVVMGGGFPAAAFGGRADVMGMLSPDGPVYQAGTLSGNPVATTAGRVTLQHATDEVYARLGRAAQLLGAEASAALSKEGVPHVLQYAGTMFSVFFTDDGVDRVVAKAPATAQAADADSQRCRSRMVSSAASGAPAHMPMANCPPPCLVNAM